MRTQPGEIDRVMTAVEVALRKRDPNRVIGKLRKMSDMKRRSYSGDSLMAVTLSTVTGLVLVFSSLGIFGLATFNVNTPHAADRHAPRRRRAQARHRAVLHDRELDGHDARAWSSGCCLALAAGYWLSTQYQLPRLDLYYLVGGVLGLWVVGQLAAWQPSLQAAKVSPAMATRNV